MRNLEIQKAESLTDIDRCLRIRRNVFVMEKGVPEDIEMDEYDCPNNDCTHFLIRYNNADVGTLRCLRFSPEAVKIQRFCILSSCRGLGIGKKTMEYIEALYKDLGVSVIEMNAKFEVSAFYEKCGYKIVSDTFTEAGVVHVKMVKRI